jgi:hypothetical protein
LVGLEPETARAFRTFAIRVKLWRPYAIRLKDAAGRFVRHKQQPGPKRNYVRDYVIPRLIALVEKYRLDKKRALLGHTGTARTDPSGVLFEVAKALRLPCLPWRDAALFSALDRGSRRARQWETQVIPHFEE